MKEAGRQEDCRREKKLNGLTATPLRLHERGEIERSRASALSERVAA